MRIKNLVICALLVLVINCLALIEGKKIVLGLIGLHALRRLEGLQHIHKLVTVILPLKYAAEAWKGYGKANAPHLPINIFKSEHHHSSHKQAKHLSAEESYQLDKWLNHYYPEEAVGLDHY